MVRELVRLKVEGLENLEAITPPVIFAANHTSHFDTAVHLQRASAPLASPLGAGHVAGFLPSAV